MLSVMFVLPEDFRTLCQGPRRSPKESRDAL